MTPQDKLLYEFGPFRLDTEKRRLTRDGKVLPLTPKAYDTLLVLVENCGEVVEKDALMDKVWQGTAVEENNLTQNISALRKALGERREEPQYIFTIQGQGYRFVAPVRKHHPETDDRPVDAGAPPAVAAEATPDEAPVPEADRAGAVTQASQRVISRQRGRALALFGLLVVLVLAGVLYWNWRRSQRLDLAPRLNSIAVLPFKSLSTEGGDDDLGAGMADALITKLGNIKQIVVRPTSEVLKYASSGYKPAEIGRELQVDAVLDGHLQRYADSIRITVQLIRVRDGDQFWGGTFDKKSVDPFAAEDRLSEEVAKALIPTLTGSQKESLTKHFTENAAAYEAYIKGRYYWNKRSAEAMRKAVSYFQDAILEDPQYALAYAGLADSYTTQTVIDDVRPLEIMPKARSAALRALELDDGLAEAHASLGYVKHRFEFDWPGAEREFKRAIELNPQYATAHQWYGWYLISVGSFDEAATEFKLAQQLDPLSLYVNLTLGTPFFFKHQYDKAIEQYKRVLEMDDNFSLAHRWLARSYEQKGRYDEAIAEYQKTMKLQNGSPTRTPAIGYVYALSGNLAAARQMVEQLRAIEKERYIDPYGPAIIYKGLGETDQVFEMLDKMLAEHSDTTVFLPIDPRFDSLRADPRFVDLLRRLNYPK